MMLPLNPNNGGTRQFSDPQDAAEAHRISADLDLDGSACSTPYVSAPSSPGRGATSSGYFFSAPASPVHYMLSSSARSAAAGRYCSESTQSESSAEFEFASKLSPNSSVAVGSMSSADELFCNGQIRPMKLSSHLQRPQILAPLIDLEVEEEDDGENGENDESAKRGRDLKLRSRSLHRKARSLSPLRTTELQWNEEEDELCSGAQEILELESGFAERKQNESASNETTPSCSTSSSRSSSSGRNSKKWIFLKDLLYRSKSEGRAHGKEKFWSTVSFSPSKEKRHAPKEEKPPPPPQPPSSQQRSRKKQAPSNRRPENGISKRRVPPSAHEVHYTTSRAQAEEMKRRTFLPYRQGLLGCLGFSSKGYGALSGFTKTLNPVSSR